MVVCFAVVGKKTFFIGQTGGRECDENKFR